jgi:prepilin-type N-terminal cleavage/methylation domain-containing protein
MPRTSQAASSTRRPSGFSLIELLVVVGIIVLLIGILVPTLGAVRTAARKTQTEAMASQVVNAMSSFKSDTRRLPGYFNVAAMADQENWAGLNAGEGERGFTETENVLLELAGGILPEGTVAMPTMGTYTVGPGEGDGKEVVVSTDSAKSAAGSGYLKMDSDSLFAIAGQADLPGGSGEDSEEFEDDNPSNYIDLVDPFGMPMLIWKRNLSAKKTSSSGVYQIAAGNYNDTPNASFYWSTNAGYLSSSRLGASSINLRQESGVQNPSLLGGGDAADADDVLLSLASIVGNPGFVSADGDMGDDQPGGGDADQFARPEAFRGDVIVTSAGPDKIYFAKKQDPGLSEEGNAPGKHVGFVRLDRAASPVTPEPGTSEVERFDDVIVSGG